MKYHSDYFEYSGQWKKIRDVIEGEDRIKEQGTNYLPKLSGQTEADYNAYKQRALLYNATGRSVEAFVGMIFRKPVNIELPDAVEERRENISLENESVNEVLKRIAREAVTVGRGGILVDYPTVETGKLRRIADVNRSEINPYMALYDTEDIINWKVDYNNGNTTLRSVMLEEKYYEDDSGDFPSGTEKTQYRKLIINEDGYYEQQVLREGGDDDGTSVIAAYEPVMNGSRMTEIPFYFYGVTDNTPTPEKPAILDLVNLNLSHYRSSADYEHGLHWTALPTLVITGATQEELGNVCIGPEGGIVLENEDASAEMLEFQGKGLDQIESALDRKEGMMADLGARLIMDVENPTDAAETVQLKQQGQNSVLGNISDTIARAYESALKMLAEWQGAEPDDVSVTINKNFTPWKIDSKMVQVLMAALQQNRITQDTFIRNLQRGEIVREEETIEDYKMELERQSLDFPGELNG